MKKTTYLSLLCIVLSNPALARVNSYQRRMQSAQCQDLKIGESKKVEVSSTASQSGVELKYTLKKADDRTHDIYINYNLKIKASANDGVKPRGSEKRKWIAQAKSYFQTCFDKYNSKLEDGYGRKLRLNVYDSNKHKHIARPPSVKISIVSPSARSHSRAYEADIRCSTVLHEAFHLLGLPDEYVERWNAWNPHFFGRVFNPFVRATHSGEYAMDCRSHGSHRSLMRDSYSIDSYSRILHSKHVDIVLYPNCTKRNKTFYKCAKNAYRTSKEHGGIFGCRTVPKECRDGSWYGI